MGKSTAQSNKGADFFLVKFWTQMLDNPDCKHVCEWAYDGRHLIIYDTDALMAEIKSRGVCKQKDYDSFARQLRIYRWGRVKADDCGVPGLPENVKVWRHPRLNRDSPLVEVANVTRNAPPKPNKAAIAAGLPEKPDTKSRKKATDIYEGSPSDSKHEDEDQESREGSSIPVSQISSLAPPPSASFAANGDIPVHQTGQHLPSKSNLPPLMPAQMASLGDRPVQRLPLAYSRPSSHAMTSSAKSHKLNAKKKQTTALVYANKPAFDVETSIFDPNNNFGVTTARPLNTRRAGANRSYDNNDVSSDSSLSSDEELDNLFTNGTLANVAGNINVASNNRSLANLSGLNINGMPSLSLPQVSQAFLSKVNYDNAAIEHAAQNPANYDRLPWSAPAIAKSFAATNGQAEDYTHDDTLASLESRLQTISASLRAADAAAAQHAN